MRNEKVSGKVEKVKKLIQLIREPINPVMATGKVACNLELVTRDLGASVVTDNKRTNELNKEPK
jgi:hypothetical protein